MDNITGALAIIEPVPDRDSNEAVKKESLSKTYDIAVQIKAKMKEDHINTCTTMQGLNVGSFNLQKVGPVFDNMYGWRLTFNFYEANPLNLDNDLWQ